jgi:hypothetical protein
LLRRTDRETIAQSASNIGLSIVRPPPEGQVSILDGSLIVRFVKTAPARVAKCPLRIVIAELATYDRIDGLKFEGGGVGKHGFLGEKGDLGGDLARHRVVGIDCPRLLDRTACLHLVACLRFGVR